MKSTASLRVCYFGTYRAEYSRNRIVMDGLRQAGVDVIECHAKLWRGEDDRLRVAQGGWLQPGFVWRVLKAYLGLLCRYRQVGAYDVLLVGYPGHYDVFLARWLSHLRRKPLAWDVLNSLYLILVDRGIAQQRKFTAKLVHFLERRAMHQADRMFLDTPQFIGWFSQTYGVPAERFRILPISADERTFQILGDDPLSATETQPDKFQVLYYGTYIPNHGVSVIVEAAYRLQEHTDIAFELVGDGPERAKAEMQAKKYRLTNVKFIGWLEKPELKHHIQRADVCLGTFGNTLQSSLTYNNKIHEAFAMRKAVITAETPATPNGIRHGEHLYQCKRNDAQSLADAILALKGDPNLRQRLAENGQRIFRERFDVAHTGEMLARYLEELATESMAG